MTDCSIAAKLLRFKQSSEMQGVLGKLETSAPSKSDPIKPVLLLPHLFPASFRIKPPKAVHTRERTKPSKPIKS